MVLGQIEARAAQQRVADQDHGDEQDGEHGERAAGEEFAIGIHFDAPFSRLS